MTSPITRLGKPNTLTDLPDPEALVRSGKPSASLTPKASQSAYTDALPASRPPSPSSSVGPALRFRSSLTHSIENGRKQYKLNGNPVGPSYPPKAELSDPSFVSPERVEISRKNTSATYQRRNTASPFVKKVKVEDSIQESQQETQKRIEVRNELAILIEQSPKSKHFSVEIFLGEKDGKVEYLAKKINGFSLNNTERLNSLLSNGELSKEELAEKFDELSDAVKWLNDSGYFHNDINLGNIMYDADKKALVLIDFEGDHRSQRYGGSGEQIMIDIYKNIVTS